MNNRMSSDIWLYLIIVLTLSGEFTPEAIAAMDSTASVGVVGLLASSN